MLWERSGGKDFGSLFSVWWRFVGRGRPGFVLFCCGAVIFAGSLDRCGGGGNSDYETGLMNGVVGRDGCFVSGLFGYLTCRAG